MYVDINDISKYKRCSKKKYKVWVCMPPAGTCVINKFEQPEVVQQLKGRTYFTYNEVVKIKDENPALFEYLREKAYIVDDKKRFVLSGTQGELWVIDAQKLAKTYTFATGEEINMESLKSKSSKGGLDWQQLETRGADSGLTYACFVPNEQSLQIQTAWGSTLRCNAPCVSHGKGDFIVCAGNADGSPNLGDRWVVNGLIFGDTYDNRGWGSNLHSSGNELGDVKKPDFSLIGNIRTGNSVPVDILRDVLKDDGYFWMLNANLKNSSDSSFNELMEGYVDCPPDRFESFMEKNYSTDYSKFVPDFKASLSGYLSSHKLDKSFTVYLPLTQTLYMSLIKQDPLKLNGVSIPLYFLKVYSKKDEAFGKSVCDPSYVDVDSYNTIIQMYGGSDAVSEKFGVVFRLKIKGPVGYIKSNESELVLSGKELRVIKSLGKYSVNGFVDGKVVYLVDAEYI